MHIKPKLRQNKNNAFWKYKQACLLQTGEDCDFVFMAHVDYL
jgi:hypothetical protein